MPLSLQVVPTTSSFFYSANHKTVYHRTFKAMRFEKLDLEFIAFT